MPGQHGHHIGDDEGGRRPGHQQEGDEGHSLQEAKHLANAAERALRCARPGAGGLRAAGCLEAAAPARAATGGAAGQAGSATAGTARRGREGEREERGEAASGEAAGPGWVGRGRPGLVAKPVKSQSGGRARRGREATSPPGTEAGSLRFGRSPPASASTLRP